MRKGLLLLLTLLAAACADRTPAPRIVYDFETDNDLDRIVWQCRMSYFIDTDHSTSGSHSLRCEFGTVRYPGISFCDFPTDLSGYQSLSLDLFNDEDVPINLVIRIDDADSGDQHQNRYNDSFMLAPGENLLAIPMESIRQGPEGRTLDLSRIERFLIFLYQAPGPVTLYVDRIALR